MKRKRGFTLLELVVVIIIIAVLASLGFSQYNKMVERARGAEAWMAWNQIRNLAIAWRLEYGSINTMTPADVNIGTDAGQLPGTVCQSTHYFVYDVYPGDPILRAAATRCASGGKPPQYGSDLATNPHISWTYNLETGEFSCCNGRGGTYGVGCTECL